MNHLDPTALTREIIGDRIREANQHRLVRECRRPERAATARTVTRTPQRHSRLWSLVHFRQAYS
ncbi:MAG TPA: hypothetical protein VFI19_06280 [Nocardioides sp.]|jgi:hypothetical protein|nr:hypothetical protein [Nocardioides sp.]